MTRHYDGLAVAEPVFGELQNCMDLAIAATLIVAEPVRKAGCSLPTLVEVSSLKPIELHAPTRSIPA